MHVWELGRMLCFPRASSIVQIVDGLFKMCLDITREECCAICRKMCLIVRDSSPYNNADCIVRFLFEFNNVEVR